LETLEPVQKQLRYKPSDSLRQTSFIRLITFPKALTSKMPVTFTNLYDRDAELDFHYYLNTHMPLVARLLGPSVIVSWALWKLPDDGPFSYEAEVTWASLEARNAALKTEAGAQCVADLQHFVKKRPMVLLREPLG